MKPFLLLQHRYLDEAAHNEYRSVLRYGKLDPKELVRVRMEKESISGINPAEYSGIITGGGPSNVSDTELDKPAAQRRFEYELNELYDQVFDQDIPYLGMCYGMGSLTKYLNGTVSKEKYSESIGGVDIEVSENGEDPILEGVPSTFRALVGHKESCEILPDGAVLLASSSSCPVQMIRCRRNIYATQFHPELDVEGISLRIRAYKNHGYFKPEEVDALIKSVENEVIVYPQKILENFVDIHRI